MHKVARRDLEALVFVAIATAPPLIKRKLKSKLLEERDQARGELARSICDRIDNDSYMVIVTEMIAQTTPYPRLGAWGVDEPAPAEVPKAPRVTEHKRDCKANRSFCRRERCGRPTTRCGRVESTISRTGGMPPACRNG